MTPADRLAALRSLGGLTLGKGHGTENDFLLVFDPDDELSIGEREVAALCDRRGGLGADGFIRAVRSAEPGAEWFMDYRNADGSLSEMCGNGVRVLVEFLRTRGVELTDGRALGIATRGGLRRVTRRGAHYAVEMGEYGVPGGDDALAEGTDTAVEVPGLDGPRGALSLTMPNPHTVVALPSTDELAAARLELGTVTYEPVPPLGTNLELVVPGPEVLDQTTGERLGTLTMRVLERGVGETRSCGTGCCAAAVAVRAWAGAGAPDGWLVDVPGGRVRVDVRGREVTLTGPAVMIGEVTLAEHG